MIELYFASPRHNLKKRSIKILKKNLRIEYQYLKQKSHFVFNYS